MMERGCVVIRRGRSVLAFHHPLAGAQLGKGQREAGESAPACARRDLREDAGVTAWRLVVRGYLPALRWSMVKAWAGPLPPRWDHARADDGGHVFRVFWHRLGTPEGAFPPHFRRALRAVEMWP